MTNLNSITENMLSLYDTFPHQIKYGFEKGSSIKSLGNKFDGIVLCGMGGSGVTGDYIKALALNSRINVPVEVIKEESLPSWVNKNYLVIGVSYSGNTHETLSCVREAYNLNAKVIAITSGGKLEKLVTERGSPIALIEKNYYPRTAMAELVSTTLGALRAQGINLISDNDLEDSINVIKETSRGEGLNIANSLANDDLYIISGCGDYEILANRWRQEFSENTKAIAKTEAYPESAHNDIVVWQKNQNLKIGYILFESEGKLCSILTNLLNEIYIRQNKTLVKISPRGNNLFSKLMQGSLLAGYVSVYLAKMKGVDTTDTSITGEYKKSLEKANLV